MAYSLYALIMAAAGPLTMHPGTINMGAHLLLDLQVREGLEAGLDDMASLTMSFRRLIQEEKMTIKGEIITKFEPQGFTMVFGLAESHVSYHSFPEIRSCSIDFYFCSKDARPTLERIGVKLLSIFVPIQCNMRIIDRTLPATNEKGKARSWLWWLPSLW